MQLRDYQKKAIAQIYAWYRAGKKSILLVAPTGSGKTLMAAHIMRDAISRGCRTLFIVHREPLIDQAVRALISYGVPAEKIGYIKAGHPHATRSHQLVVASIQTLARRDYPGEMGLICFDESHTTSFWDSSKSLIQFYSQAPIISLSKVKFLHLSATPFRTKKEEHFSNHVEAIVYAPSIAELIKQGFLAHPRYWGFDGAIDLRRLRTGSDGDFTAKSIRDICESRDFQRLIVDTFVADFFERKAIAFCGSVEQSKAMAELFKLSGVPAAHIQAETPTEERREIFSQFREGSVRVLSSVATLTEGFDEPSCDAVILARPTKSQALLIQMAGRGLRKHPEKTDCALLDFAENFKRLGLLSAFREPSFCPVRSPREQEQEPMAKTCPQCKGIVHRMLLICPHCGYQFVVEKQKNRLKLGLLPAFKEILTQGQQKRINWMRGRRKHAYSRNSNPDRIWELWDSRYPSQFFCNDWLQGAIFGGESTPANGQIFLDYLQQHKKNDDSRWINHHYWLEFQSPAPPRIYWWDILQASPGDPSSFATQYQILAAATTEEEDLELLNYAYKAATTGHHKNNGKLRKIHSFNAAGRVGN